MNHSPHLSETTLGTTDKASLPSAHSRTILIAPTSARWAELIAQGKALDAYAREHHRQAAFDTDLHLCSAQRQQRGEGYLMVEISTNLFGYCVRDTMNDGLGVLFGGRSRPGTTKAEAIAWAHAWHAERPTHREVILGYEGTFKPVPSAGTSTKR